MKYLKTILLLFLLAGSAKGQQLHIGDTIPEALWHLPLQVVNHPEGKDTITLADYKDKLIIIDFWATWCVPCVRSLHKLDTLQSQLGDRLAVVPTTFEDAAKVGPFVEKQGWSLPMAVSDKALKGYFPHRSVPHQVWIKNNVVRAIANYGDATAENILKIWEDDGFTLHTKKDILDFDRSRPMSTYADRVAAPILFSSTLTGFIDGAGSSIGESKGDTALFINYINVPAMTMYQKVLQKGNNRIALRSDRMEEFVHLPDNRTKLYVYQRIAPKETPDSVLRELVLQDLNAYFKLELDSQMVDRDCYVISGSGKSVSPDTALDNEKSVQSFSSLVSLLNFSIVWIPDQPIFIDESGYEGKLLAEPYEVLQKDIEKLRATLAPYGLTVRKEKRPIKMYILSDALHALQMRASEP